MNKINERTTPLDSEIEVMKCKNDREHDPIRWDGLWDPLYAEHGMRIVQWTCKQCGGTFSKEVPELEAQELNSALKR